jgi:cytochrome c biogenesis factor
MHQKVLPDKLVSEAELHVTRGDQVVATLAPAQHFHLLQRVWTTEVAIHATWRGDLYTILHAGEVDGKFRLTFVDNPMIAWMWMGAWVMGCGAVLGLWPSLRRPTDVVQSGGRRGTPRKVGNLLGAENRPTADRRGKAA